LATAIETVIPFLNLVLVIGVTGDWCVWRAKVESSRKAKRRATVTPRPGRGRRRSQREEHRGHRGKEEKERVEALRTQRLLEKRTAKALPQRSQRDRRENGDYREKEGR